MNTDIFSVGPLHLLAIGLGILVYLLQEVELLDSGLVRFFGVEEFSHGGADVTLLVNCVNEGDDLFVDFGG